MELSLQLGWRSRTGNSRPGRRSRPGARAGTGARRRARRAVGRPECSRARMRPLTTGTIGSSSPASTSVGCRSRHSQGMLVQPADRVQLAEIAAQARGLGEPGDASRAAARPGRCGPARRRARRRRGGSSRAMVAARGGQRQQARGDPGMPPRPRPRAGGGEHQPAHPVGCLVGELLGDDAAERHAEHVDLSVAERVEHPLDGAGDAGHPPRPRGTGRFADAGRVEADRLHAARDQFAARTARPVPGWRRGR